MFFNSILAAEVTSLSREQYRQDSADNIYWEVSVTCAGIEDKRIIQQEANGDEWCAREVEGICHSNKMTAASRVCGNSYKRALTAKSEQSKQPSRPTAPRRTTPPATTTAPASSNSTPVVATAAPRSALVTEEKEPIQVPVVKPLESSTAVSTNPTSKVVSKPGPDAAEQSASSLLQDQIEIEEQRIKIEQQKLELRRQELELQKRELELSKQKEPS